MTLGEEVHGGVRGLGQRASGVLLAVLGGLLTGGFAAWAYYDDTFRPLAHVFGIWIALVALISARQIIRRAVIRSCSALTAAVLVFYVGKKVMYGIEYPGMPYSLNGSQIVAWIALAIVVGAVLGAAFSFVGTEQNRGAAATAGVIGLLIADAYRRSSNYHQDASVVLTFALIGIVLVLAVGIRGSSQMSMGGRS